jgi:hypothetical protein
MQCLSINIKFLNRIFFNIDVKKTPLMKCKMTISGMVESFEKYEVMEYLTNSGRESKQYVVWQ